LPHAFTQSHLITAHRKERERERENRATEKQREGKKMKSEKSHPRLRASWEGKSYNHGLSSTEMDTLTSICEAIFPPLDPPPHLDEYDHHNHKINGSLQSFFHSSASQKPIPDEVIKLTIFSTIHFFTPFDFPFLFGAKRDFISSCLM